MPVGELPGRAAKDQHDTHASLVVRNPEGQRLWRGCAFGDVVAWDTFWQALLCHTASGNPAAEAVAHPNLRCDCLR